MRKKIVAAAYLIFLTFSSQAQVKIGLPSGAADNSAILDVSNTGGGNKGFLAPKVALTALNAAAPVSTPAAGLLVYNTATAGTSPNNVVPGYFYWNGSQWVAIFASASATSSGNIYANDGTLTGSRTVTQAGNTLTFTGGDVNVMPDEVVNPFVFGKGWVTDNPRVGADDTLEFECASKHYQMTLLPSGNIGVNTISPTTTLDVNGSVRVRAVDMAVNGLLISPLYADQSGNLLRSPGTATQGSVFVDASNLISAGNTATLTSSFLQEGAIYKAVVIVGDQCGDIGLAEYYIFTSSFNTYYSITGLSGINASSGTSKSPIFAQTNRSTISTSWSGKSTCDDGTDATGFNYDLQLNYSGTAYSLDVTNNGNTAKLYTITLTRMN